MRQYPVPPVPDLARAKGWSSDEMFQHWLAYYDHEPVPWNYVRGTKLIRGSYGGFHHLPGLLLGCQAVKNDVGRKANTEVVTLAAPVAFGRHTSVFDLPRQQFQFGHDVVDGRHVAISAGYRIPFFFVENGIIRLYHLQPRKSASVSFDEMAMVATIYKRFILDYEFYGQKVDLEIADVSLDPVTRERAVRRYSMDDFQLWTEKRLQDRLTLIAESLRRVWASGLVTSRPRRTRRPDPDMTLFD